MQVSTNVNALTAASALNAANLDAQRSIQKISTGQKVSNAADDPSAIGPATRLKVEIASRVKVSENLNAGIGVLQIMDSAMNEIGNVLQSMRELAVSSASGSTADNDRTAMDTGFNQYNDMIDTIAGAAKYNGTSLLSATGSSVIIQSGIAASETTTISSLAITKTGLATTALGVDSVANATAAITALDTAIGTLSGHRASVGAQLTMFEAQANLNSSMSTASTRTYGNLVNVDYASETANLASAQIRQNASAAMMAQAHTMSREMVAYLLKSF